MTGATTVRSFLEAARSALCNEGMTPLERMVTADAEIEGAQMVLDDQMYECWLTPCRRAWHPLRFAQAQRHCDEHRCGQPVRGRFIPDPMPDPVPVVGARRDPSEEAEVERMADSFDHAIQVQAEALARLDAEDTDAARADQRRDPRGDA